MKWIIIVIIINVLIRLYNVVVGGDGGDGGGLMNYNTAMPTHPKPLDDTMK